MLGCGLDTGESSQTGRAEGSPENLEGQHGWHDEFSGSFQDWASGSLCLSSERSRQNKVGWHQRKVNCSVDQVGPFDDEE